MTLSSLNRIVKFEIVRSPLKQTFEISSRKSRLILIQISLSTIIPNCSNRPKLRQNLDSWLGFKALSIVSSK